MSAIIENFDEQVYSNDIYSPPRRQYQQIVQEYNPALKALWTMMNPVSIPCFEQDMVEELHHSFHQLAEHQGKYFHEKEWRPVNYCVIGSRHPKVFNLGGDLSLFIKLIKNKDRTSLMHYAKLCVDAIYTRFSGFNGSVITISVVQGEALGGGFELALSSDILIAERGTRMGFPEILFNMFPGMGAYSLLYRKVGMQITETLINSGNTYKAEDLEKMGVVDVLAEQGEGRKVAHELIKKQEKQVNGLKAIHRCRRNIDPITNGELQQVADLWVDTALSISDKDLHMMRHLVNSQRRQQEQRKLQNASSASSSYEPMLMAA